MTTSVLTRLTAGEIKPGTSMPVIPRHFKADKHWVRAQLTPRDFESYLLEHGPRVPSFAVNRNSRPAPASAITLRDKRNEVDLSEMADPIGITEALEAGYSVSMHNLTGWAPKISQLCRTLAHEMYEPILASAFFTPPRSQALAHHHDTVSVFLCQTYGSKRWNLYRPVLENPLHTQQWSWGRISDADRERLVEGEPDYSVNLEEGEVLWIPRGWIHEGMAEEAASLHLTLRVEGVDEYWATQQIAAYLAETGLRADMPACYGRNFAETLKATQAFAEKFSETLASADIGDMTDHLVTKLRERFLPNPVRPLTEALLAPAITKSTSLIFNREALIGYDVWSDGSARIHVATAESILASHHAAFLTTLIDSEEGEISAECVMGQLGQEEGVRLIRRLLALGVLSLEAEEGRE